MRHRHSGPSVRYRTSRDRIRYRERPLHKITGKKEGIRGVRRHSERERHLDNIYRLQEEIKELQNEFEDKQQGTQDLNKSAIKFDRDRFKDLTNEERKNLSIQDINETFESETNPYKTDMKTWIDEEDKFKQQILSKQNAIEEEKEFLEE